MLPKPSAAWAGAIAALLSAAVLVLLVAGPLGDYFLNTGTIRPLWSGSGAARQDCSVWQQVHHLSRCTAEVHPRAAVLDCCSGAGYVCRNCTAARMMQLQCYEPRSVLMQPAPSCSTPLPPPKLPTPPPRGSSGCASAWTQATMLNGKWIQPNDSLLSANPGLPLYIFEPAAPAGSNGSSDTGGSGGAGGNTCRQPLVRGAPQVLRCLSASGFDRVVVSGDSTVRHFWNRLVSILRQQRFTIDGGGMTHRHYEVHAWQQASPSGDSIQVLTDRLWASPTANAVPGTWNPVTMAQGLQQVEQQSADAVAAAATSAHATNSRGSASSQMLISDFIIGSTARWQLGYMRDYAANLLQPRGTGRRTLLVLSLCYWETAKPWPSGWREFIEEMRQQVGQLVLLTCPIDRVATARRARERGVFMQRNQELRRYVTELRQGSGAAPWGNDTAAMTVTSNAASAGGDSAIANSSSGNSNGPGSSAGIAGGGWSPPPPLLLDMDALTQRLPPGFAIAPEDFHYQCHLQTRTKFQSGAVAWSGGDGTALPTYPTLRFDHLRMPENGRCDDPINYAAWQLLFTMLCDSESAEP